MTFNLKVGRIFGAPIILQWDWFLAIIMVPLITALTTNLIHALNIELYILGLYFFVLLHEFGHCFVALQFNAQIKSITMGAMGGLAKIDWVYIAEQQLRTFLVAIAGPAVNAFFLILFFFLGLIFNDNAFIVDKLFWLKRMNVVIFIFNMLPVFPLDGSLILYSGLRCIFSKFIAGKILSIIGIIGSLCFIAIAAYFKVVMVGVFGIIALFSSLNVYKNGMFSQLNE